MMAVFFLVFSIALSFGTCVGFLFNNTGSPSGGGSSLSDRHYITLVDMVTEEKNARRQLEQYVLQLSKELTAMKDNSNKDAWSKDNCSYLEHDLLVEKNETKLLKETVGQMRMDYYILQEKNHQLTSNNQKLISEVNILKNETIELNNDLLVEKNETKLLKETVGQMRMDYYILQEKNHQLTSNNQKLTSEVNVLKNETKELKTDFKQWKFSVTGLQVSNITYVSEKFKTTDAKINSLMSSNNARVQDFLALLNQTKVSTSRINVLEAERLTLSSKLLNHTKESTDRIHDLEYSQFSISIKMNLLARNQNSTDNKLEAAISKMNEKVALTSCAEYHNGSKILLFPIHKTILGIKNISDFDRTGQFTCESEGLYLISMFIMSPTRYAYFDVDVNGGYFTRIRVKGDQGDGSDFDTGTAVVVASLKKKDTVSIRTDGDFTVYGYPYSCLTILKIK